MAYESNTQHLPKSRCRKLDHQHSINMLIVRLPYFLHVYIFTIMLNNNKVVFMMADKRFVSLTVSKFFTIAITYSK